MIGRLPAIGVGALDRLDAAALLDLVPSDLVVDHGNIEIVVALRVVE